MLRQDKFSLLLTLQTGLFAPQAHISTFLAFIFVIPILLTYTFPIYLYYFPRKKNYSLVLSVAEALTAQSLRNI